MGQMGVLLENFLFRPLLCIPAALQDFRPEKMSPLCEESSDLESKSHLIVLGTSGENFILVNQQLASFHNP